MTTKSTPKSARKTPSDSAPTALLQHYWLVAGQVHFAIGEEQFTRSFNALSTTDRQAFNHTSMGRAQQLLQMRLVKEVFQDQLPEGFQITDVFLIGISHLGQMTQSEFQEGFRDLADEQTKAQALMARLNQEKQQAAKSSLS